MVAMIALAAMSLAAIWLVRLVDLNVVTASNLAFKKSAGLSSDIWAEKARSWLLGRYKEELASSGNPDASLEQSLPGLGYYAQKQEGNSKPCGDPGFEGVDFTGVCNKKAKAGKVAWQNADGSFEPGDVDAYCETDAQMSAGARACYVIHRMCTKEGPTPGDAAPMADGQSCDKGPDGDGAKKGANAQTSLDAYDENLYRQPASNAGNANIPAPPLVYRITVRVAGPRQNTAFFQTFVVL
jgi:hypothetical protein